LKEKPDIIHHVTIKPILYGSIAARLAGREKIINAISGLGSLFINIKKFSSSSIAIRALYKLALSNSNVSVIFQNEDDLKIIRSLVSLSENQVHLIKGSGVDMKEFRYTEENNTTPLKVVLVGRMLYDKGINEFVNSAKVLKRSFGEEVDFYLVGKIDSHNKTSIPLKQLNRWNNEGNIKWIGHVDDIKALYNDCHIAVLPSYREGLPKSLVEAMAIGRPIVTTDVPGCRLVVKHGINGLRVKVRDVESLTIAIKTLLLDKDLRIQMGREGRIFAEKEFSLDNVVTQTMKIYTS